MPTADITSLLSTLNRTRHTSYTMPVLSPRHSSSTTLTGSYRSTFSSSSVSRPYYGVGNSYSTPRINSYSERFTSKSYSSDEGKKLYARHSSITEDSISSRCADKTREKSTRRDSLSRDSPRSSSLRDSTLDRELSLTRNDSSNSRNNLSTLSMIESVADMRNKYSPANYVPAVLRNTSRDYSTARDFSKGENISRSKSINDIGRPPMESRSSQKVNATSVNSNSVAYTNNTNDKLDNTVPSDNNNNGNNGNRVAEIRKKFDSNFAKTNKIVEGKTNKIVEGKTNKIVQEKTNKIVDKNKLVEKNKKPEAPNSKTKKDNDHNTDLLLIGGNKIFSRPAKCIKVNDLKLQEPNISTAEESTKDAVNSHQNNSSPDNIPNDEGSNSMDTDIPKLNNHTTNFASYIPTKDFSQESKEKVKEETPMNQAEDTEMENNDSVPQYTFQQNRVANNDISTSPRLNRIQSSASNNLSLSPARLAPNVGPNSQGRALGLNGLKNIGNTCFMNSVIQCLSNTRYLLEYVRGDDYLQDINTSISSMKGALIKAFSQVIQELWSSDSQDRVVNTVALKSQIQRFAPRFMGYAQQDAQEFLRYLLEGLHEDVNRVTSKPAPILTEIDDKLSDSEKAAESWRRYLRVDNSRVVDVFVGQLKSTLRCTHCGHCSVTFDPFWDLSLPIPQRQGPLRLQQCLEHFTREETLDGDEKPTCAACRERRKCTKSFSIHQFPRILVIHLKRFSPTERFRGKLNVVVDFPLQGLDLASFSAGKGSNASTGCLYNLYATSNHSGTTHSGHYTAYCRHPYIGHWHEYNDSRVSPISPKNVVSSEAYVLFYELVGQHPHL